MSEGGFLPPVVARLTANITEFSAKMAEARGEMDETEKKGESSGKGTASKFGGAIALGAAGAGLAIAGYAVKAGISMQTADTALSTHGDLTQAQATKIGNSFLNLGFKSAYSGQQMVTALAPVSGQLKLVDGHALTTAESLQVMSAASDLAEASGGALGATTQSLVSVMQAFGIKAKGAAGASNVLWNVSKSTGVGVSTLATTFQKLHSKLGEATPSIGQLGSTLVDLTAHGVTGRAAVSALTSGLSSLLSQGNTTAAGLQAQSAKQATALQGLASAKQKEIDLEQLWQAKVSSGKVTASDLVAHQIALRNAQDAVATATAKYTAASTPAVNAAKQLGITVYDAQGKFVGMQSVIAQLGPKLKGMTEQQRTAALASLFGKTAAASLSSTLLAGVSGYNKASEAANKHGAAQAAAAAQGKTLEGEAKHLEAGVENLGTKLGQVLLPKLADLVKWLTEGVTWLTKHKAVAEVLAGVIGGVVVTAFGAWAVSAAAAAASTAAAIAPILAVIAAIAALVAGVVYAYTHWTFFHKAVEAAWKGIQAAAKAAWNDVIKPVFDAIKNWIVKDGIPDAKKLWDGIKVAFKGIEAAVQGAWRDVIKPTFDILVQGVKDIATIVGWLWTSVFQPVWHQIATGISDAWTDIIKPTWTLLSDGVKAIGLIVDWLWNSVFVPAWQGISAAVGTAWTVFLKPIFDFIKAAVGAGVGGIGSAINILKSGWDTAWSGIKNAVKDAWTFIKPFFDDITNGANTILGVLSHVPGLGSLTGGGGSKKPAPASTTTSSGGLTHKSAVLPTGPDGRSATLPVGSLIGAITAAAPGGSVMAKLTNTIGTGSLIDGLTSSATSASTLYLMKAPVQPGSLAQWLKDPAPSGSLIANLLAHGLGAPGASVALSQPLGGLKPTALSLPFPHAASPPNIPIAVQVNVHGSVTTEADLVATIRSALLQTGRSNPGGIFGRYAGTSSGGGSQ